MGLSAEEKRWLPLLFMGGGGGLLILGAAGCGSSPAHNDRPQDAGAGDDRAVDDRSVADDAQDAAGGEDRFVADGLLDGIVDDATPLDDAQEDASIDASGDAGDPRVRAGFNGEFCDPVSVDGPCPVVDIDLSQFDEQRMIFQCGYPVNRMGTAAIDPSHPLASTQAVFGTGDKGWIQDPRYSRIDPAQIVELADNQYLVPVAAENGTAVLSGIFLVDVDGTVAPTFIDRILFGPGSGFAVKPVDLQSGLLISGRIVFPVVGQKVDDAPGDGGTTASDGGTPAGDGGTSAPIEGLLLSYGLTSAGFEIDTSTVDEPVVLIGQGPATVAPLKLEPTHVAVLNASGTAGASIDIIDTTATNPAMAVLDTIPLGVVDAVNLPEFALSDVLMLGPTQDGGADPDGGAAQAHQYAVVALPLATVDGGTEPAKVLIVDLSARQALGRVALPRGGGNAGVEVRGVTVHGTRAYVSIDDGSMTNASGRIAVIDFTDPVHPICEGAISVGHDLGAIAAHASGTLYVAVTDRWWETPGAAATPHAHIVAVDPLVALASQDGGI